MNEQKSKLSFSQEQKEKEGKELKRIYKQWRGKTGRNQEDLCHKLGISQGFLSQMFTARIPIPLETLLDMAVEMQFDPRQVRPDVGKTLMKMTSTIRGGSLGLAIMALENGQVKELEDFALFLASKNKE